MSRASISKKRARGSVASPVEDAAADRPDAGEKTQVALRDTAIFDVAQLHHEVAASHRARLQRIPRGESICVHFETGEDLDIDLGQHYFRLVPGEVFFLIDSIGNRHPLHRGRNIVGRHNDNDVVLDGAYRAVSRKHIIIEPLSDRSVLLTDISSHGSAIPPKYQ